MRRIARRLGIGFALLAVVAAAVLAFVASEFALTTAVQIMVARSEGRLEVDGASGSLLSAIRAKRLVWRGPGATMTADEVAINWTPMALWSRGIVVKGLGAQRITLAIQPSDGAIPPPPTLALPTTVAIDEVAVANMEWAIGTNSGRITGLTFGYAGSPLAHHIERLSLVLPSGTLTGNASIDAQPPFTVKGSLAFTGDVQRQRARADIAVSGTLDAVGVDAAGRAGEAEFALHARLTPLAAVALDQLSLDAHDLDLNAWDATLPITQLEVKAEGRPAGGGIAGSVEAQNAIPGPIDANHLPVRSVSTRFAWRADQIALEDFVGELTRGGRVSGDAQIPLGGGAGKWTLEVRDIDLRSLHSTLAPEHSLSAYQNAAAGKGLALALVWWPVALIFSARRSSTGNSRSNVSSSRRRRRARGQRHHRARGQRPSTSRPRRNASIRRASENFLPARSTATSPRRCARPFVAAHREGRDHHRESAAGVPLSGKLHATSRLTWSAMPQSTSRSRRRGSRRRGFGGGADALTIAFDAPRIASSPRCCLRALRNLYRAHCTSMSRRTEISSAEVSS
jgi:hypothetical protein